MASFDHSDSTVLASPVVLRLLNSPLANCEYTLTQTRTLLVVGSENDLLTVDTAALPDNTIVIPLEGGTSFTLMLTTSTKTLDEKDNTFITTTQDEAATVQTHRFQTVCHVGKLEFSVRPADAQWADHAFDKVSPAFSAEHANNGHPIDHPDGGHPMLPSTTGEHALSNPGFSLKKLGKLAAIMAILSLIVIIGTMLTLSQRSENPKTKHENAVRTLIAGATGRYQVVKGPGQQGSITIFAKTERDASWARQVLMRAGLLPSTQVTTYRHEEQRVNQLLLQTYPNMAFHRLKLTDANKPILVISQERAHLAPTDAEAMSQQLMTWMPYATEVPITTLSDQRVAQQAKAGLDQLGIAYTQTNNPSSTTFSIEGSLNDAELARVRAFINRFYQDFGSQYVYFSVELKDDWLKGKSFKYGDHGYVKMAPKHWYFPKPL